MEKIFNQKNFNYFVWTALGSRVNIYKKIFSSSFYVVSSLIIVTLFATGVFDTGGKFAAGIVDTVGKFATGINNTRKIV
jgi:hypothetical protein